MSDPFNIPEELRARMQDLANRVRDGEEITQAENDALVEEIDAHLASCGYSPDGIPLRVLN